MGSNYCCHCPVGSLCPSRCFVYFQSLSFKSSKFSGSIAFVFPLSFLLLTLQDHFVLPTCFACFGFRRASLILSGPLNGRHSAGRARGGRGEGFSQVLPAFPRHVFFSLFRPWICSMPFLLKSYSVSFLIASFFLFHRRHEDRWIVCNRCSPYLL